MEFLLLGEVVAYRDGRRVDVGHARQQCVLVVLLVEANTAVSADQLIDRVWGDRAPVRARGTAYSYLSRLRSALAGAEEVDMGRERGGYVLRIDPQRIDVHRFRRLLDRARAADDERAIVLLEQALALWRGEAFAGLDTAWINRVRDRLQAERLAAESELIDRLLRRGRHLELLPALAARAEAHPLDERIAGQLLLALYRGGRPADALTHYQQLRDRLADELGADPALELQRLHQQILTADPALTSPVSGQFAAGPAVPAQLPADLASFTGRIAELDQLAVWSDDQPTSATVLISAIDGMAGVGKTAFAVHAAHRLADRFPDGQLFIDLHGYTEGVQPVEAADALDRLLRSLGVPGEQIPIQPEDRAALYRSRLAGRKMLILLDNAATDTQVKPLLPGTPGCLVLITSRRRLVGLDDAHTVSLDVLSPPDAVALFTRIVGKARLATTPPNLVAEIVELCGRLPLAIRTAAARLRSRPAWTAAHLAERLRDHQHRLTELEAGQRSVTAALDLSYHHLTTHQKRTYRLLSLHPGPDLDPRAAAALTNTTEAQAARLLDELLDTRLLGEPLPGRYRFHDLIRAHATHTTHTADTETDRRMALTRLLDHYTHTTTAATNLIYPHQALQQGTAGPASIPPFDSEQAATAWLAAELDNILAVVPHATDHDRPTHIIDLSAALAYHLRTRALYSQAEALHTHALSTARRLDDRTGQAEALTSLGHLHRLRGRYGPAADSFEQALTIARATGHRTGEVDALNGIGDLHRLRGRYGPAADSFEQALTIARATGHRTGEVDALIGLGYVHWLWSRYGSAASSLEQALTVARTTGNLSGEAAALNRLGAVHWVQGQYVPAANKYQQALHLARQIGNRQDELGALIGLGHTLRMQSRYELATDSFERALTMARTTGNRTGELGTLTGLGDVHRVHGRYRSATDYYEQVLHLAREMGNRNFQFEALHGLGLVHTATGHPDQALIRHHQALDIVTELGQPGDQARAHDALAHSHYALADPDQARIHWQRALSILTALDITFDEGVTTDDIRAHLDTLDHKSDPP